ncbi:hypothetical protein EIK77_005727 [Talaromyces pinophilus]|nr:hypothetical protein EIK77_005727 [Talaromyces pinophilus]
MNVTVCIDVFMMEEISHNLLIGIFSGNSTIVLGIARGDEDGGVKVKVHAGDVIVLPAGTAHSMADSSDDYRYIGVYPEVRMCSKQIFALPLTWDRVVQDGVMRWERNLLILLN